MKNILKVNTVPFVLQDDNVYFHEDLNSLYYIFSSPKYCEKVLMTVNFVKGERKIKSIEIDNPLIINGVLQYPINISEEQLLGDYDKMIELRNEREFR